MTPAWSTTDWDDAWTILTGTWATLRRDGAEQSYRGVLTRFDVATAAEAIGVVVETRTTDEDEPKPADLAVACRAVLARNRPPVVVPDDDRELHDPADERDAWRIAQERQERRATLGFSQWVALGCPPNPDTLPRVAATLGGSWGAYARAAMRCSSDPDRALALRRLAHHMTPDDLAVLTDAVMP